MTKKIKNVLTPYLVLSSVPIIYFVFYKGAGSGIYSDYIFSQQKGIYYQYLRPTIMYLWSGYTMTAYWYVPFIMIVFLLSPLFIIYIQLQPSTRLTVLGILLMVAAFVQRPLGNLNPIQSVVYFAPVYTSGILSSIYRHLIYEHLEGKEIYLIVAILLLAALQVILLDHYGNFHKPPFVISYPDILLLQKLLMCIFFMVFLHRFENRDFIILNRLAAASFAIYFLHPFVMYAFFKITSNLQNVLQIPAGVLWLTMVPTVVMSCFATARLLKAIFRSHSRQVVGW